MTYFMMEGRLLWLFALNDLLLAGGLTAAIDVEMVLLAAEAHEAVQVVGLGALGAAEEQPARRVRLACAAVARVSCFVHCVLSVPRSMR